MTKGKGKVTPKVPQGGGMCACDKESYGPNSITKRGKNCNAAISRAERKGLGWRLRRKFNLTLYTSRLQVVMDRNNDEKKRG
jgi:hypothetical protein